jgi:hypothetical protein
LPPASGEVGLGNLSDRIHATNYKRVRVERCDLEHQRAVVRRGGSGLLYLATRKSGA